MKMIITSTENNNRALFDRRFGRASWFCLYDDETGTTSFHENTSLNEGHGAGQLAAEKIYELGATRVISGDFGPTAKNVLDRLKIQMVIIDDDMQTIADVIKKLK